MEMTTTTKQQCAERVYHAGSFRSLRCSIPAIVERERTVRRPVVTRRYDEAAFKFVEERTDSEAVERVWYCGTHDPERVAARRAKKDEEASRERASRAARYGAAEALAAQLGGGVNFDRHSGGAIGVALSFGAAEALIARLRRLEAIAREAGQEVK